MCSNLDVRKMMQFIVNVGVCGALSSAAVYGLFFYGGRTPFEHHNATRLAIFQDYAQFFLVLCAIVSIFSYLSIVAMTCFQGEQNLKKKYDAKWALVTGSSSGIGKEIALKLAKQGLNIVMAAPAFDKLHAPSVEEFRKKFPNQEFRRADVNLSQDGGEYMEELRKVTDDILVQIVFSNAGYLRTGMFSTLSPRDNLNNYHCNATASVHITHHFLRKLKASKKRGCFVYTSSPAGMLPAPMSAMYGATKAFLTAFATCIAPEVKYLGIDVGVIHPSPVTSRFYDGAHAISALSFFKGTGRGPAKVVSTAFAGVGRQVIIDQGYYAIGLRMVLKLLDSSFMAQAITATSHTVGDFVTLSKEADRHDKK